MTFREYRTFLPRLGLNRKLAVKAAFSFCQQQALSFIPRLIVYYIEQQCLKNCLKNGPHNPGITSGKVSRPLLPVADFSLIINAPIYIPKFFNRLE